MDTSLLVYSLLFVVPYLAFKVTRILRKPNFEGKTVWITGASSGIGEALTYEFVKRGAQVIISARNEESLNRVKSNTTQNKVTVLPMDLSDSETALEKAKQVTKSHQIDILVNNAGIGQRSTFISSLDDLFIEKRLMELNYFSVVALTKAVAKQMIEKRSGQMVVISSVAGLVGSPCRSSYSGSKYAISGFYESMRNELEDFNVNVTTIYPGYVRTDFSKNALIEGGQTYGQQDQNLAKGMDVEEFATKAVHSIFLKKREVVIASFLINFVIQMKAFFPALYFFLLKKGTKSIQESLKAQREAKT